MRFSKPRCVLVYAVAPVGVNAREANRILNEFVADQSLPLVLFHDHFIEERGGVALFFVKSIDERDSLLNSKHLEGWKVEFRPLIFSHSPSAFDEQISYTLKSYRNADWEALQDEERPNFGDARIEAETAEERIECACG